MTAAFTALFGHCLGQNSLLRLPRLLDRSWDHFEDLWPTAEIIDKDEHLDLPTRYWQWQNNRPEPVLRGRLAREGQLHFEGPCGFGGTASDFSITLSHSSTSWADFVLDPNTRYILRETCRIFAQVLETDFLLYVPEAGGASGVLELGRGGHRLEDMAAWLRKQHGPPAREFPDENETIPTSFYFREKFL